MTATLRGVVKWWDDRRGIGFLTAEDGRDHFVHHTEIALDGPRRSLVDGEPVTFQPYETDKGPRARMVVPTGRGAEPVHAEGPPRPHPGPDDPDGQDWPHTAEHDRGEVEPWPPLDDPPDVAD